MESEETNSSNEMWVEAWHEARPGLWQARLAVGSLPFDFLLAVHQQPDGRHTAQITKTAHGVTQPSEVLMQFYPELSGLLFEAIQECSDKAREIAANPANHGSPEAGIGQTNRGPAAPPPPA